MSASVESGVLLGAAAAAMIGPSTEVEMTHCTHPKLAEKFSYCVLIHDKATGDTAVVDVGEAAAIKAGLDRRGWTLTHIFITHHHIDHTIGNLEILRLYPEAKIYGPRKEKDLIPGITHPLDADDEFWFGSQTVRAVDTSGHTIGHMGYYLPEAKSVFCGDAVFVLGAGKIMEGSPGMCWESMKRVRDLPDDTVMWCAHEYTGGNVEFATKIDGDNPVIQGVAAEVARLHAEKLPTVPSMMYVEKAANPFMRIDDPSLIAKAGLEGLDEAEAFAKIRQMKNDMGAQTIRLDHLPPVRLGAAAAALVGPRVEVEMVQCEQADLVEQFSYGAIIHDKATGDTAAIDSGDVGAIKAALDRRGWTLTHILTASLDRANGNLGLLELYPNVKIYGSRKEKDRIPGITHALDADDKVPFGSLTGRAIDVGGPSSEHIAYHFSEANVVFCGDVLVVLGVGRMKEGASDVHWQTMKRLRELPDDTVVYCAHEYTGANAQFAVHIDGANMALQQVVAEVSRLRSKELPTVPSVMFQEKACNPFLRADNPEFRAKAGVESQDDTKAFFELFKMRESFK